MIKTLVKITFALLLFASSCLRAQETKQEATEQKVYINPDVAPEFPGGMPLFYKYVKDNYKKPLNSTPGKIISQFIVDTDGSLTDVKILRQSGAGTGKEMERLLLASPKWKPGLKDGKPVKVILNLPVAVE